MGVIKRAKQFFQKTRIVLEKNIGKKIVGKKCKKRFLYSHEYRDQKNVGKKRAKRFFQKTRIVLAKRLGKSRKKVRKNVIYIHTNIVTKKWREIDARNIFS